jgi:hypothetical protein
VVVGVKSMKKAPAARHTYRYTSWRWCCSIRSERAPIRSGENIIVSADPQPRDHPAVASRPTPARRPPEKSWAAGHLRGCLRERERDRWAGEWEKINPKSGAVPRRSSGAPPRFRADKYVAVDFIFFSSVPPNTHNITAVFLPRDNRQQAGTPSQNIVP